MTVRGLRVQMAGQQIVNIRYFNLIHVSLLNMAAPARLLALSDSLLCPSL